MSLFPAYSEDATAIPGTSKPSYSPKNDEASSWLHNSSYQAQNLEKIVKDVSSDSSDETVSDIPSSEKFVLTSEKVALEKRKSRHTRKRKKERRKHDREKVKREYEPEVQNVYFEDKNRDRRNNTINTLCSRVRPYYETVEKPLGFLLYKKIRKETYTRYYTKNIDVLESMQKKDTVITRENTKGVIQKEEDTYSWCTNLEDLQKTKIKAYNEKLTDDPTNIPLWIEYIEFQDVMATFQKYQSIKDVRRATILKKLSIVEKALEKVSDSVQLLQLKLSFMSELLPADQCSNELETLVNKDSGNIILWQAFIMITQGSVAMCTVPRVLDLYSRCFCILKQRGRTNPSVYDERLLQMLYWYLTFLRHTGLWEQMWETIRMNLSLNLSLSKDSLSFAGMIDEKKLISMEEVILMSRLPLNQLWQRTESLRENCHWVSVSRDELELVGDSRRFVLPDDIADFVYPMLSRNSNFRMAIHSLLSLKVPLLPTRDYMLKELTLKEIDWGVESSEAILPFIYPAVGEMAGHKQRRELLSGILEGQLTSGPQYLMFHPAQEAYLDFIRQVFHTVAENLTLQQRTSMYIWWLRFERLLIFLHKDDTLKNDNKGKKLRTTVKEFLKKEENRNNLHFYREYALIEREMGRFENCVNILETAIQSQGTYPSSISNLEERAALFSLYRTIIETLLDSATYKETHKQRVINIMKQMVPTAAETELSNTEEYLESCVKCFLQENPAEEEKAAFFLPNLTCDTIACYAYFLYIKNTDICKIIQMYATCIEHFKDCPSLQEILWESQIALLQLYYEQKPDTYILTEPLNNMLNRYPDNFYALSISACIESALPAWKFNSHKSKLRLWKAIVMCLANRRRIHILKQLNDPITTNAAINKLLSFHQTLSRIRTTRCCPLLWRFYMLLLREYNLCEKKGEEVYHESIAQCPWARSIYIDAAEIAPQLLTQIQDVIREKELRMHVTPDELDILRG